MRMPVIGAAIGGLALGAMMVVGSRYVTSPVQASLDTTSAGLSSNPVLVDCADGQRAIIRHATVAGQSVAQVQCVGQSVESVYNDAPLSLASASSVRAYPASLSRPVSYSAPAPVRTRSVSAPAPVTYRTVPASKPTRSWKKSAIIIGGSAAGGAGLGAILGGKGGAAKGAVVGGVAGVVYDIATRNKG